LIFRKFRQNNLQNSSELEQNLESVHPYPLKSAEELPRSRPSVQLILSSSAFTDVQGVSVKILADHQGHKVGGKPILRTNSNEISDSER
jgi:hypothetical protein